MVSFETKKNFSDFLVQATLYLYGIRLMIYYQTSFSRKVNKYEVLV